ncbi:sulfurtransferase TusA family protein [Ureibacillus composti]|nr:sulfurtransferase TusA family protein [Ureibacillus composti]
MIKSDVQLDAKGLACPMPIVKTKKAMNDLTDGQILEVQATDQGSTADLKAWAESVGHQYIGTKEEDTVLLHYIRKSSDDKSFEKQFEQTITNEEVIDRAANGGMILDVREEVEYAFGHIPGSKSIPIGELEDRLDELNREEEIYVICRTGTRSDLAAQKLVEKGFTKVLNVLPGMGSWIGDLSKSMN